jgi:hypothetical protein
MIYLTLLLIPFRAILYRLRGEANKHINTTEARLFYHVIPDTFLIFALELFNGILPFPGTVIALLSGLASYGAICLGHSKWQDNLLKSFLGMTWITSVYAVAPYLPLALYTGQISYYHPVAAMILVAPLCWLSYTPFMQRPLSLFGIPLIHTIPSSEPEELMIGACIGLVGALEFLI